MADANFIIRARDKSRDTFDKIDSRMKGLSRSMKMSLGGLGAGLSVAALVQYGRASLSTADNIDNLSQRMRLGLESVQSMGVLLNETGISTESFEMTMVRLSQTLDLAKAGNEKAGKSFEALGISFEDLSRMNPEQALEAVTRAMYENSDSAEVNVAATEVLGSRSGKLQSILLQLGSEGFGALNKRMKDSSQIMTEDVVKAADKMEEGMARALNKMNVAGKTKMNEFLLGLNVMKMKLQGKSSDEISSAIFGVEDDWREGLATPEEREERKAETAPVFNPDLVDPQNEIDRQNRIEQLISERDGLSERVEPSGGVEFGNMREIYKLAQGSLEEGKKKKMEEERNKYLKEIRDELKDLQTGVQVGV